METDREVITTGLDGYTGTGPARPLHTERDRIPVRCGEVTFNPPRGLGAQMHDHRARLEALDTAA